MANVVEELKKKYEEKWLPETYIKQYFLIPNPWETKMATRLHEIVNSGLIKGPRGIDIGCGPIVHRMAILSRICDEIVACDFSPSNIDFLKNFLSGQDTEVLGETLQVVANLERNTGKEVQDLQERLRSKIKHVVQCDVTSSDSVQNLLQYGGEFDCAISNGCLEAACLSYDSLVASLKKICGILKQGASFVLAGYFSGNEFMLGPVKYECFDWDEDIVRRGLDEAGFRIQEMEIFGGESSVSDICNCTSSFFSLSFKK